VGFLNPTLYALAAAKPALGYQRTLHDITSGTSGVYSATKSYDLVTGLGSPTGRHLANLLPGK
jgi:kumamolisin